MPKDMLSEDAWERYQGAPAAKRVGAGARGARDSQDRDSDTGSVKKGHDAGSVSPRSPSGSPRNSPKSQQFKEDKLNGQLVELKHRYECLEGGAAAHASGSRRACVAEEATKLKEAIDEGGQRHERIKKAEKSVLAARAEIQQLM